MAATHPDFQGLRVVGPLDPAVFPEMAEGWLVMHAIDSPAVARMDRLGWNSTPSGPKHSALWRTFTAYGSEVHRAAQLFAAGVDGADPDPSAEVRELAAILVADDSLVFGGMAEARCLVCGESFNPHGDEDVRVMGDGSVVFEHYLTADEAECGGFGPIDGRWGVEDDSL
jgi:hypothetical protein